MALTGDPLLALAVLATTGALVALVRLWHRGGRARHLLRTGGILLCQALAAASIGLVVNRAGDFYPSWRAVFQDTGARAVPAGVPVTGPGGAVTVRRGGGLAAWAPPGSARWHLTEAPRLALPTRVPPGRRLPLAVLLLPPGAPDATLPPLVRDACPGTAVLALRPAGPAAVPALAGVLPRLLPRVLPVAPYDWALVGVGPDAPLAVALDARDAVRYGPVALVAAGREPTRATLARLRAVTAGAAALAVLPPNARTGPGLHVATTLGARMADALRWVAALLPPPLAPPRIAWSGGVPPGR